MDFKLPDVGEGITEGKLVKWHVKEGDSVKADAVLCEVETDKSVVEIPSPTAGVVKSLPWKEGDVVKTGQVLAVIDEGAKSSGASTSDAVPETPSVSQTTSEKTQSVPVADKPIIEESTPTQSQLAKSAPEVNVSTTESSASSSSTIVLATPYTRLKARELGVDISKLKGSGPAGRVTFEDVQKASGSGAVSDSSAVTSAPTSAESSTVSSCTSDDCADCADTDDASSAKESVEMASSKNASVVKTPAQTSARSTSFAQLSNGQDTVVPLSTVRKAIAKHLHTAVHTMAQASHMDSAQMDAFVALRESYKADAEKQGVRLTFMPLFVKVAVAALKQFPILNARFDEQAQAVTMFGSYNVGIAVDAPGGLVVPVVRNADKKSVFVIAQELGVLAQKARSGKLQPAEMQGGTFSISNVGTLGGEYFIPIVNYPQTAILGLGAIKDAVMVVDGVPTVCKKMGVVLSYDHRLMDGADAARFVSLVVSLLEEPERLLLYA